jgi:predicted  nucleic acid-binding Zn-ribbon protein
MNNAKILLDLASTDRALLRFKKQLEELPQRAQLLELRTKRAEVDAKAEQVVHMRKECERTLKQLQDEEAMLQEKTVAVQEQIDKTNNYKEVAALTHEIESFAKRAEKIEFDMLKQLERSDKIAQVEQQANNALAQLARQDEELFASYQTETAALKKEVSHAQQLREESIQALSGELRIRYEKAREAKGGLGAAHIEGTHCSACRVELTEGQLAKLRSGDEIGECPYCHRLLVVSVSGENMR